MKKAILFFFILAISFTVYAQADSSGLKRLPFVSYNNPTINKPLKEGRYLTLHLYTDSAGSHTYTGTIFVGGGNALLMVGGTEEYHGYSDAGFTYEERVTSYTNDEITVVPYQEIEYVSLQPRLRPLFGTLTGVSLATVCICFPLALVDYSTKSFNPSQIVGIAAISLVTNAVLYKIFHTRKFRIKGSSPTAYMHQR